jgi:glutaminyl-tRNA synthetase
VVKDEQGNIVELHCTYDPATRGGEAPDGRKVKATIHWVSAEHAKQAEVRLYDHLFTVPNPGEDEGVDFTEQINPNSMQIIADARVEPSLSEAKPGERIQFERVGYFCVDPDSAGGKLAFNRTVTLKDEWAKIQKQQGA